MKTSLEQRVREHFRMYDSKQSIYLSHIALYYFEHTLFCIFKLTILTFVVAIVGSIGHISWEHYNTGNPVPLFFFVLLIAIAAIYWWHKKLKSTRINPRVF